MQDSVPSPSILQDRLTTLEFKLAYQEDALNQLDTIIIQQQDQLDLLKRQVESLIDHIRELKQHGGHSPQNERPPHY